MVVAAPPLRCFSSLSSFLVNTCFFSSKGKPRTLHSNSSPKPGPAEKVKYIIPKQKGKDVAFDEFRKKGSVWFSGDAYVFADDLAGIVLLNPAFPQHEGTNLIDLIPPHGKLLQRAMVELLKKQDGTCQ